MLTHWQVIACFSSEQVVFMCVAAAVEAMRIINARQGTTLVVLKFFMSERIENARRRCLLDFFNLDMTSNPYMMKQDRYSPGLKRKAPARNCKGCTQRVHVLWCRVSFSKITSTFTRSYRRKSSIVGYETQVQGIAMP